MSSKIILQEGLYAELELLRKGNDKLKAILFAKDIQKMEFKCQQKWTREYKPTLHWNQLSFQSYNFNKVFIRKLTKIEFKEILDYLCEHVVYNTGDYSYSFYFNNSKIIDHYLEDTIFGIFVPDKSHNDQLVGYICYSFPCDHIVYINFIEVFNQWKKMGVGKKAIHQIESIFISTCQYIQCWPIKIARPFWEKLGYYLEHEGYDLSYIKRLNK